MFILYLESMERPNYDVKIMLVIFSLNECSSGFAERGSTRNAHMNNGIAATMLLYVWNLYIFPF